MLTTTLTICLVLLMIISVANALIYKRKVDMLRRLLEGKQAIIVEQRQEITRQDLVIVKHGRTQKNLRLRIDAARESLEGDE